WAYYASDQSRRTAEGGEMWTNLTKPVIKDNCNKFISEMTTEDIRIFESVAFDSLEALGYQPLTPRSELLRFTPEDVTRFNVQNEQRKRGFVASDEDLRKRKPQLDLINRIRDAEVNTHG